MPEYLRNHLLSLTLIAAVAALTIYWLHRNPSDALPPPTDDLRPFLEQSEIDFSDPMQQALFQDLYPLYKQKDSERSAGQILDAILTYQREVMEYQMSQGAQRQFLDPEKIRQLMPMYIKFIIIYLLVLVLTYYGVETLGLLRFIRKKQGNVSYLYKLFGEISGADKITFPVGIEISKLIGKALLRGVVYFILFSPAYVLAYTIKTEFNTNTIFFMALLGIISNGLLITYANKFYAYLTAESRKGYVDTARVKNLHDQFRFQEKSSLNYGRLLALRKRFPGHILDHIYPNAHTQYFSTLKEQANYLISGLIIIEMALNIHGHYSYELLQQLLYKNYDIVTLMVFGIFLIVKGTQIVTDWQINRLARLYGNITGKTGGDRRG